MDLPDFTAFDGFRIYIYIMHAFQSGDAFLQILGILFLKIGSLFKVGFKGVFLLDMMEVPTCYIINV